MQGQGPNARMTLIANNQKRRLSLAPAFRGHIDQAETNVRKPKSEYDTRDLFSGQRQIQILHNEEAYRLSITKQGKLILTK